jgi:ubiquitin-protein ligase E3 C
MWRTEWDLHELERTSQPPSEKEYLLQITPDNAKGIPAYDSAGECYAQMRLLLHFLEMRLEMDRVRLAYFGTALQKTLEEVPSIATGDSWTLQLNRLSNFTVEALRLVTHDLQSINSGQVEMLLNLLLFLSRLIPKYMARNAVRYYSVLARLLSQHNGLPPTLEAQLGEAVLALLTPITAETMTAYIAFGFELLTSPNTMARISGEKLIGSKLNYKMLTAALHRAVEEDDQAKTMIIHQRDRSLWLLAHLVFLHGQSLGAVGSFHVSQETEYIKLLSVLLAAQASEIRDRIDILDQSMADTAKRKEGRAEGTSLMPLPPFVREQVLTLIQKTSIVSIMSQVELTASTEEAGSDSAQALATYALTLTRVFPGQRAEEIRRWLYSESANRKTSAGITAIQYFWHYSRSTTVFKKISRDHRDAVPLLKPFLGVEKSMSSIASQSIQQEWRTLLLFLELYSWAIRYMDDEEFLAGGQFGTTGSTHWGAKIRESSLPLDQVRELVIFLKFLAFALYWNSKNLQEGDHLEQRAGLGAYFGVATPQHFKQVPIRSGDAAQESARMQLRDLVTGLLRSIHQRE